jgi:lipopolysaccharide export system permease protein
MILHRMIFWELLKSFILSLLAISTILTVAGIVKEGVNWGFVQVLHSIPLLIPETLPFTLPTCLLFATCLVYGRLSHDHEILAIRSSGIHVLQILWPAFFLGLVLSAVTLGLSERFIPYTIKWGRLALLTDAEDVFYALLRREGRIDRPGLGFSISVRGVDGRKCIDPVLTLRNKEARANLIAYAASGELEADFARRQLVITLHLGAVLPEDGTCAYFKDCSWRFSFSESLGNDWSRPSEMSFHEIFQERQKKSAAEAALVAELESARLSNAADRDARRMQRIEKLRSVHQQINALDAEIQKRLAFSMGCLGFVLVGCPMGIWFGQRNYLSTFLITFLPIVLFYYPLLFCGVNLAKKGYLNPVIDFWMADSLLLIVALGFLGRLCRS